MHLIYFLAYLTQFLFIDMNIYNLSFYLLHFLSRLIQLFHYLIFFQKYFFSFFLHFSIIVIVIFLVGARLSSSLYSIFYKKTFMTFIQLQVFLFSALRIKTRIKLQQKEFRPRKLPVILTQYHGMLSRPMLTNSCQTILIFRLGIYPFGINIFTCLEVIRLYYKYFLILLRHYLLRKKQIKVKEN